MCYKVLSLILTLALCCSPLSCYACLVDDGGRSAEHISAYQDNSFRNGALGKWTDYQRLLRHEKAQEISYALGGPAGRAFGGFGGGCSGSVLEQAKYSLVDSLVRLFSDKAYADEINETAETAEASEAVDYGISLLGDEDESDAPSRYLGCRFRYGASYYNIYFAYKPIYQLFDTNWFWPLNSLHTADSSYTTFTNKSSSSVLFTGNLSSGYMYICPDRSVYKVTSDYANTNSTVSIFYLLSDGGYVSNVYGVYSFNPDVKLEFQYGNKPAITYENGVWSVQQPNIVEIISTQTGSIPDSGSDRPSGGWTGGSASSGGWESEVMPDFDNVLDLLKYAFNLSGRSGPFSNLLRILDSINDNLVTLNTNTGVYLPSIYYRLVELYDLVNSKNLSVTIPDISMPETNLTVPDYYSESLSKINSTLSLILAELTITDVADALVGDLSSVADALRKLAADLTTQSEKVFPFCVPALIKQVCGILTADASMQSFTFSLFGASMVIDFQSLGLLKGFAPICQWICRISLVVVLLVNTKRFVYSGGDS